MHYRSLLWTIPFLCMIFGYFVTRSLIHRSTVTVPNVIGMPLEIACKQLSAKKISTRIIHYKNDPDLPHHTVIGQIPYADEKIRPHQAILLTISQEPEPIKVPDFRGKKIEDIEKIITPLGIKSHYYPLTIPYPQGSCLAQYPYPDTAFTKHSLIIYGSSTSQDPILWPDFTGKTTDQVCAFLAQYQIEPVIRYEPGPKHHKGIIVDQRPLPASIIVFNKAKPPIVQLKIVE